MANIYCGLKKVPKGSKLGTVSECAKLGKIGLYGKYQASDQDIEIALGKKELSPEKLRLQRIQELAGKRGKLKRFKSLLEYDKKLSAEDKIKLANDIKKLEKEIENFDINQDVQNIQNVQPVNIEQKIEKGLEVEKEIKQVKKTLKKKVVNDEKANIKVIDSVEKIDNENKNILHDQNSIIQSIEDELYSDKKISKPKFKKVKKELAVIKKDIHKNRSYDILVSENIEKAINNVNLVKENLLLNKIQKDIMMTRMNDLKVAQKINKIEKQLKLPNESNKLKKDNEKILKEQVKTVNIIKDKIKKDVIFEDEIHEFNIPKYDLEKEALINHILNFLYPLQQLKHINRKYLLSQDLGDLEQLQEKLLVSAYGFCSSLKNYSEEAEKMEEEQYREVVENDLGEDKEEDEEYNHFIKLIIKLNNDEKLTKKEIAFMIKYIQSDDNVVSDETKLEVLEILKDRGYINYEEPNLKKEKKPKFKKGKKKGGSLFSNIKKVLKSHGYGYSKNDLCTIDNDYPEFLNTFRNSHFRDNNKYPSKKLIAEAWQQYKNDKKADILHDINY